MVRRNSLQHELLSPLGLVAAIALSSLHLDYCRSGETSILDCGVSDLTEPRYEVNASIVLHRNYELWVREASCNWVISAGVQKRGPGTNFGSSSSLRVPDVNTNSPSATTVENVSYEDDIQRGKRGSSPQFGPPYLPIWYSPFYFHFQSF